MGGKPPRKKEVFMRRVSVLLAAAILIVTPAHAVNHENFSIYSELFGATDITDSEADEIEDCVRYDQDGCEIIFRHRNGEIISALIRGEGDAFLAYCYGSIMQLDPEVNHSAENGGQLLGCYLMAHNSGKEYHGKTVSGCFFTLRREEEGYSFIIQKNAT